MDNNPRVLIAASIYPPDPGGPALHAQKQFEWLQKKNIEVGLVALAHYRKWPIGIRHIIFFIKILLVVSKYDVVYSYDAVGSGIPAYFAARIFGKKFIVRVGGDVVWERKAEKNLTSLSMYEWYENNKHIGDKMFNFSRFLLERTNKIVVTTPLLASLYIKYYGIPETNIVVIPNPVPDIHRKNDFKEERTMIYASRLVAYKNLDLVIKTFAKVLSNNPDIKFVIMGNGPERKNLESLSKELGIERRVIFRGSVSQSDVIEETSKCLFAIAPALTEFNPNYILQSVAFGKPFLISKENGLVFSLPDEFTFDPKNANDLESKILNFISESEYKKLKKLAQAVPFRMTWEENLELNLGVVNTLFEA